MCRLSLSFLSKLFLITLSVFSVSVAGESYSDDREYGCDQVFRLRLNESFAFSVFPPPSLTFYGHYGLHRSHYGPQECTWVFVARDRDCQLQFRQRVAGYSRGDLDCDAEYYIFGDENQEERFCGFKKPPRALNSTGSRFFITHFQRNGRYGHVFSTTASPVAGVVRCGAKEPTAPPRPVCDPGRVTCVPVKAKLCSTTGSCEMKLTISDPVHNETDFINCETEPVGQRCLSTGQMCWESVGPNSPVPTLPPPPPINGTMGCTNPIQVTCSIPGNCAGDFFWT